jgi:aspartate/methionine/tyrosine aminotransferase
MFFPMGIPAQANQAREATINASIGQLTDGEGHAMALPAISQHLHGISLEEATLYAPQGGNKTLRTAWKKRIEQPGSAPISEPFCTVGLTHGLNLISELFVDEDTDVLLPEPGWGNYDLIFGTSSGGNIIRYPLFKEQKFQQDAIRVALSKIKTKGVLVLNFPSNPTGYTPSADELKPWLDAIRDTPKPIVVVCDDAYAGFVYESDRINRSPFHELIDCDPEKILPVKVDGATKELVFFGARVGFVTFGTTGPAADALELKIKGAARASVSSAPAVSQSIVLSALNNPDLEKQISALRDVVRHRYQVLKTALDEANISYVPFNSGFFTLIPVQCDPEELRLKLLKDGMESSLSQDSVPSESHTQAHVQKIFRYW